MERGCPEGTRLESVGYDTWFNAKILPRRSWHFIRVYYNNGNSFPYSPISSNRESIGHVWRLGGGRHDISASNRASISETRYIYAVQVGLDFDYTPGSSMHSHSPRGSIAVINEMCGAQVAPALLPAVSSSELPSRDIPRIKVRIE